MTSRPRVSVVMATRNRAHLVAEAVASILQQSERDLELIIVDDCSDDGTPEVLHELARSDPRVIPLRVPTQRGPGAARNFGVAGARADYVAILDDDDLAVVDRIATQCAELDEDQSIGLVFSSVVWLTDHGEIVFPGIVARGAFPVAPDEIFQLLLLESNKIPNTTIVARTSLLRDNPYPDLTWGEDWLWVLQLTARGVRMRAISRPLVKVRRGGSHDYLMRKRASAFASQRQVLRRLREWLSKEKINRFDHLFPHALSNQLTREARHWGQMRGIGLCLRAVGTWPPNPLAYRTLVEITQRGWRRLMRRRQ